MEDNTQKAEELNNTTDLNFIQKEESIPSGCGAGEHQFKIIDLIPSGEYTELKLKCVLCQAETTRKELMNINSLIDNSLPAEQPTQNVSRPVINQEYILPKTEMSPLDIQRLEAFKLTRAAENATDSFWDSIKRG